MSALITLVKKIPNEIEFVQSVIDRVNEKVSFSEHKILKFAVLEKDFSIVGGEITETLKPKRKFIMKKYEKIIEEFYEWKFFKINFGGGKFITDLGEKKF